MDDLKQIIEMLEKLIDSQKKISARVEAIEFLLPVFLARNPEAKAIISSTQLHLETIEQDASKADFSRALALLLDRCECGLPENRQQSGLS